LNLIFLKLQRCKPDNCQEKDVSRYRPETKKYPGVKLLKINDEPING